MANKIQNQSKSSTISIIIPIYKVEAYLPQCLDSVTGQTYRDLEILLIDDGSPDGCGKICDAYAEKDARIRVVHKENEGLSAARNDGMKLASGEWIAFVDSDDWCEPDYFENLIHAANSAAACGQSPDIVFAGGYYRDFPQRRAVVRRIQKPCVLREAGQIEDLRARVTVFGLPWDKLYRAEFLKQSGFVFDRSIRAFEDFLFNFQVLEKAREVALCPAVGYHYRQVAASIANGFNPNKPEIIYAYLSRLYEHVEKNGTSEKINDGIHAAAICAVAVAMNAYYFHPANPKSAKEVQKELQEFLSRPYLREAIFSPSNRCLTRRQTVLKYALRIGRGGGTQNASPGKTKTYAVSFVTIGLSASPLLCASVRG